MKRLVLAAAAVSLGAGGLVAAAPALASQPAAAKIKWAKCTDDPKDPLSKAECAQLPVPLNYRKPNGKKISIAISRVAHTDKKHYKGVLVGNPGGPGGSGLVYSVALNRWLTLAGHQETAASYDTIGFDPRGVGSSKPALTCDADYGAPVRPDYVPHSKKEEQVWKNRSKGYAKDCARNAGWLLPHLGTSNAARDLDVLRAALGQKKLNYYGFSYGTYLGATYGTLFPKRVGRFVLDGNVDTREVWYDAQLSQDKAFERNIKFWFAWIAKWDKLYHLGKTQKAVETAYYKARAAAKKTPIPIDGYKLGPDELDDTVLSAGYSTGAYQPLAKALSAWITKKDSSGLNDNYTPYDDNGFAMYLAVQGADARWPRNWTKWHNDAAKLYKQGYRFNTWSNVWFNAPIAYWPFNGGPALKINGKGMNKALLVQSTLDAATPYPGGVQMHKVLPSRLIAELGGKTHANTLNGNACLDDAVAAYLNTGKLPADKKGPGPDATCKAVPALNDPDPTASTLKSVYSLKDLRIKVGQRP